MCVIVSQFQLLETFTLHFSQLRSYADDTAPYSANKTNDLVIKEMNAFRSSEWFDFNYMKLNSGKIKQLKVIMD